MNNIKTWAFVLAFILVPLPAALAQPDWSPMTILRGAIIRGDTSRPELALVFTGDEYADGAVHIQNVLKQQDVKASFFLTGKFYRNPDFEPVIRKLKSEGHYLGAHSDQHLLYCDWENRDSLLVTREEFREDLLQNYRAMQIYGITVGDAPFFLPPFEWYNDSIAAWTRSMGLRLINNSAGTLSHADYTLPGLPGYRGSSEIFQSILDYETSLQAGLNGFILLIHIGTAVDRTDKFYYYLKVLVEELKSRGYRFKRIDELLGQRTPY